MHAYQRRYGDVYMHVAAFEKGIDIIGDAILEISV